MSPKRALARLVLVFLEGRNYDTMNPYARPEVREALRLIGLPDGGVEDVAAVAAGRPNRRRR